MKKYALLAGVDFYDSSDVSPLKYAIKDTREVARILEEVCGFEKPRILENPTDTELLQGLDSIGLMAKEDDIFFFLFTGHGLEMEYGGRQQGFLMARNAHQGYQTGMINLLQLQKNFSRIDCRQRLIFLDCCRNTPQSGKGDIPNLMSSVLSRDIDNIALREQKKGQVTMLLKACRMGERAYEWADVQQGVFSWFLKEGLQKDAWSGSVLEARRLCHFVQNSVKNWSEKAGKQQWPEFQQLESAEDIILAGKVVKSQDQEYVSCPLCGKNNEKKETFCCRGCGIDSICLSHQNRASFLCSVCEDTSKEEPESSFPNEVDAASSSSDNSSSLSQDTSVFSFSKIGGIVITCGLLGAGGYFYLSSQQGDIDVYKPEVEAVSPVVSPSSGGQKKEAPVSLEVQQLKGAMGAYTAFNPEDGRRLQKMAEEDNPFAIFLLARSFNKGIAPFAKDPVKGKEWQQKNGGLEKILQPLVAAELPEAMALQAKFLEDSENPEYEKQAEALYRKAAELGYAYAQTNLGWMYEYGKGGLDKDEVEAVDWYRKAAEQGYARAQFNLGEMYYYGRGGLKKDKVEAVDWYRKAAEQGHAAAQTNLGVMYYYGTGDLDKDEVKAVDWYRKAAEQGYARAQFNLGEMYYYGRGGLKKDKVEAVDWYRKAAEQGHAAAQTNLGVMYYYGTGDLDKDEVKAVDWYRKAAEQGHARAQFNLGVMYSNGKGGLKKDKVEAVDWYRKAAEQGYARAQFNLGVMYSNGKGGLKKDKVKAVKWYRKAAEQGHTAAQTYLGEMHESGKGGLDKDEVKAVDWYRKAAEQGNARAQFNLGVMYSNGKGGLKKDEIKAVELYRKAAEQGHAEAQTNLGVMYSNGKGGLKKDEIKAVEWYRKAVDQGNAYAQTYLGEMYYHGRGGLKKDEIKAVELYRKAAEQGHAEAQTNLGVMYEYGKGDLDKDEVKAVELYRKAAEQGYASAQTCLGWMYENGKGGLPVDIDLAIQWYQKAAENGSKRAVEALQRLK